VGAISFILCLVGECLKKKKSKCYNGTSDDSPPPYFLQDYGRCQNKKGKKSAFEKGIGYERLL
jgi:hypothetical protein